MVLTETTGGGWPAFSQCAVHIRPHHAPHGHDADEESGSDREARRENQHGQIESDRMESRRLGRCECAQREDAPS